MSTKSIAKNYLYNLAYQILTLLLPLVTASYLSRTLGANAIGIYSYTYTIVNYFVIFGSLGIALYGQREIAYVQNEKSKRKEVFIELVSFRFVTLLLATFIYFLIFMRSGEYSQYYKILLFELLAAMFDISWFFQGLEEFKKTVTRNILVRLTSVLLIFVFVKTPADLNKYLTIYAVADFIGNISLWIYLPKYFKGVKIRNISIINQIPAILLLFIPQLENKVYNMLDTTMLGNMISDKSEVGYYEQSQKIIRVLLTLVTSLGTVMVPRIANMFATGEKKEIYKYMRKSFNFVFLLGFPAMFGIIATSKDFVPLFFGYGYDRVVILMNILSPIILLMGVSNVLGTQYLLPSKKQKEFTKSVTIGIVVNFILNYIFIKLFRAEGACIATILSQLIVAIVQMKQVGKYVNLKRIFKLSYKYIFSGLIMFIACMFIRLFFEGFICVILQIIVGVVVYFSVLIILKDEYIYSFIRKLRKIIVNKISSNI